MEFRCRLGTAGGEIIEGVYVADSEAHLRRELEEKGLFILSLQRRGLLPAFGLSRGHRRRIGRQELLHPLDHLGQSVDRPIDLGAFLGAAPVALAPLLVDPSPHPLISNRVLNVLAAGSLRPGGIATAGGCAMVGRMPEPRPGTVLVSADAILDQYGVTRLWK